MTQPLNYTTKAIESLSKVATSSSIGSHDRLGLQFVQGLLRRAEVFTVPDSGALLDRSKLRPQVPGLMFRPPFPVTALEYVAANESQNPDPLYEVSTSSRRIALAWEWDGRQPNGPWNPPHGSPAPGEGVFVASISYFDEAGIWLPVAGAALIPYEFSYETGEPSHHQAAMVASGRVSKQQAAAPKIPIKHLMLLLPDAYQRLARQHGALSIEMLAADLMDEFNSFADLSVALACRNVRAERRAQPDKLNKARIKAGKLPLKDYHVLTIDGAEYALGSGGPSGGGVRSHLRRGHIRRLDGNRVTWVNSTIVNGSKPGFVGKQYAVATGGDR